MKNINKNFAIILAYLWKKRYKIWNTLREPMHINVI